jgi:ABC-type spermidine/putrescine transport system permease subunit II
MSNLKSKGPSFSSVVLFLTIIFLFIPLFVVTFFSLNSAKGMQWESASLIWYKKLIFDSPSLWVAFKNSLIIAFSSSITAVLLGALAGIGIKWYRFKGKSYITTVSYLPILTIKSFDCILCLIQTHLVFFFFKYSTAARCYFISQSFNHNLI